MRKILAFLVVFLLFFTFVSQTLAAKNFSTDYSVTYNVLGSSDTNVNLNITPTNLTENYYASSYDVTVGFDDIRNAIASDNDGKITPIIKKNDQGSIIQIPFNSKILGLNNKLNFNISFNTSEIAQDLKSVWDVNIPGISSSNDFENFNVTVVYPSFLGEPTFIKPNLTHALQNTSKNSIKFTRQDLGESGISLAFGKFQVYDFNLTYHLENSNVFATRTEIALPPTTNYQDIAIKNITPKPSNVYIDDDGNWLAQYTLPASKKVTVIAKGQAKVYLNPKSKEALSEKQKSQYLKQDKFWETQNPEIKKLANELKTPRNIYEYVVENLNYDFSRVESNSPRLGAAAVLKNPTSAVCLEFTDLFIALSRAAGIPAREINGYAYTDNSNQRPLSFVKDILHAWPEYFDFDKKAWIMVDPTWGNTTRGVDYFDLLDFDHFAFVIKGKDSSYPIPAGGYKFANDLNKKDVNVTIASAFTPKGYLLKPKLNIDSNIVAGFPIKATITVENTGSVLSPKLEALISSEKLSPGKQTLITQNIPPYGLVTIPFSFDKTPFLTNRADTIRIAIANGNVYKRIYIAPFFLSKWMLIGGVLFGSTILIISIVIKGYRRISLFRRKKSSNLRGQGSQPQETSL